MYFVANWKMNHDFDSTKQYIEKIKNYSNPGAELVICPPFPLLNQFNAVKSDGYTYGAQNLAAERQGAYTGEVSVDILKQLNCNYVIIGHSERRKLFHENDAEIAKKVTLALECKIKPILCIGETKEQRVSGSYLDVIGQQLEQSLKDQNITDEFLIAYEPVWSIGTGLVPENKEITEVFDFIINKLSNLRINDKNIVILYGGSVNTKNLANLLEISRMGGFLIGSASLDVDNLIAMANFSKGN